MKMRPKILNPGTGFALVLLVGIAVAGELYFKHQQAVARRNAHEMLTAVADLKIRKIAEWHSNWIGGARLFFESREFAQHIRDLAADPASAASRFEVLEWLKMLRPENHPARVTIFDPQLQPLLAVPAGAELSNPELCRTALQSRQLVVSDLHRDVRAKQNGIHLEIAFPVFPPGPRGVNSNAAPLAVILEEIDPYDCIYPLVRDWPTPSRTAETLLVRQEGQ